jgi:hypothetical protein
LTGTQHKTKSAGRFPHETTNSEQYSDLSDWGLRVRGWIVIYSVGCWIIPKHYKTEKMANKFAMEHRDHRHGCEAVVINVEDMVAWINTGVDELERMFKL